jgi:predicted O-methyltransferase YrrM
MLLKPGGIILADNVTFRGYVNNPQLAPTKRYKTIVERLKVFIDKFINHPDLVNTRLIQLEDGLLYGEKRK